MSNSFHIDWNVLISTLIGGGLSLLGAIAAVLIQGRLNQNDAESKEKILLRGFIQSIKTESTILWGNYCNGPGKQVEALEAGAPLLVINPITEDYFTIYNNSSFLIGRLGNEDLSKAIVKAYSTAKVLIDSYRFNNELIREMNQLEHTAAHSGSSNLSNHIRMKLEELKRNAPDIVELHNNTKENINNLSALIEKTKI